MGVKGHAVRGLVLCWLGRFRADDKLEHVLSIWQVQIVRFDAANVMIHVYYAVTDPTSARLLA